MEEKEEEWNGPAPTSYKVEWSSDAGAASAGVRHRQPTPHDGEGPPGTIDWRSLIERWAQIVMLVEGRASGGSKHVLTRVLVKEVVQSFVGSADISLEIFQLQYFTEVDDGLSAKIACVYELCG